MVAAIRRLVLSFSSSSEAPCYLLVVGWLLGAEPQRSVSLGLDVVGVFFLVIGAS